MSLSEKQLRPFGVALIGAVIAHSLTVIFRPYIQNIHFVFFYAAVSIVAAYAGFLPGMLTTGISLVSVWFFVVGPAHSFEINGESSIKFILFGASATVVCLAAGRQFRSMEQAHQSRADIEAKLSKTQETFKLLVESVRDYAIFMLDSNGIVRTWNAGAERIKGYSASEIIGQHFSRFYTPKSIREGLPDKLLDRAIQEGRVEDEGVRVRKDGTTFFADVVITPLYDPQRNVRGFVKVTRDVSERKEVELALQRKEEELLQSRKIEAIGRLAGGVAHDFNNLLTGIRGIAEDLAESSMTPAAHSVELKEIVKATQRASGLTRQLLQFGRQQIISPVVLNVNTLIQDMQKMLKRLIGEDIELVSMLARDLRNIKMDPGQVEQILVNLLVNARDAMPQGGNVTIETSNVDLTSEYSTRHIEIRPGPYVLIAVSDTGTGMDERTQSHLFEPYYTTKGTNGAGLGLATVYGIVKQNGGSIFAYSNPGAGTTFKVYFPVVSERLPVEKPRPAPSIDLTGTETILVVEDEDIVRRVAAKALSKQGYAVLQARTGQEALGVAAAFGKPIHLLLTDVIMPGMNGRQLAEMLQASRPETKVLYTSGYTENIIAVRGMLKPGFEFIEKTFTAEQLLRKVRDVLNKPLVPDNAAK